MGHRTSHASICRFCGISCPLTVEMEDGQPVKATGNKSSPTYYGFCCTRGKALPEQMSSPLRLLHSMKRAADGRHGPVSSEQAMDEVAQKVRAIIDRHGARSVALYIGTYAVSYPAGMYFALAWMRAIGSPMIFSSSSIDQPGKDIANALLGTWEAGMQSFTGSDVWLMVGANPLVSLAAGMPVQSCGHRLSEGLKNGLRLIVIDPRRSQTAKHATIHIQPRPGEDAAILAGMIRILLAEGLYDHAFVNENVKGLDELRGAVEPFTPARVAACADIPEAQLIEAARLFATAKRGLAAGGTGANMSGRSSLTEYLIQVLNTLCGRFIREGEPVPNPGVLLTRAMPRAQARPPRPATYPDYPLAARNLKMSAAGMPTAALADEIIAGGVRALFSLGGNPVAAWPDQNRTLKALKQLDVFAQLDIKMSASSKVADYVIAPKISLEVPTVSFATEPYESATTFWGFVEPFGMYAPKLMDPPAGSDLLEEWEFFYGLAQRMQLPLRILPVDAVTASTRRAARDPVDVDMANKPTTDDIFEMLTRGSRISLSEVKRHPDGAVFPEEINAEAKDPTCPHRLDVGNGAMMSELDEVARVPTAPPAGFPYLLISRRLAHFYNSTGRDLPSLIRKGGTYNPAFMHSADIAALGLAEGDAVEVSSPHGCIPAIVETDDSLRRGLVSMTHAFGDLPKNREQFRQLGSNTSQLTSVEDDYDKFSGIPRMSSVPVKITRRITYQDSGA